MAIITSNIMPIESVISFITETYGGISECDRFPLGAKNQLTGAAIIGLAVGTAGCWSMHHAALASVRPIACNRS